jgi:hypothetical protein
MTRQTRPRRQKTSKSLPTRAPPTPLTDNDRANVLSKYSALRHRDTHIVFKAMGPRVEAGNPEELQEATYGQFAAVEDEETN